MKVEKESKIKIFLHLVTVGLLICSFGVNLWLKNEIDDVTKKLQNCEIGSDGYRSKREIHMELDQDDGSFFLPLYTQINPKTLKHLCDNRYEFPEDEKHENELSIVPASESSKVFQNNKNLQKDKNRTKFKSRGRKHKSRKFHQEKNCQLISALSFPKNYGSRLYEIGSAVRFGNSVFITEYSMGYMLFEYDLMETSENLLKVPSNIYTLPMPFGGTDHAVGDLSDGSKVFYYHISSTDSILGYNLKSDKSIQKEILDLEKSPLFKHSGSFVDLEFDRGFVYGIYRSTNNTAFTVLKMDPESLREIENIQIVVHFSENIINSFVSCGVFYSIRDEEGTSSIEAVFDLQKRTYINNSNDVSSFNGSWKTVKIPTNVQYDQKSDSLTAFDNGQIYSITVVRNL